MAKNHPPSSSRRHLRRRITDMVHNIEAVMLNINCVLGDVNILVKEIDSITERLETHYENKLRKREIHLDANCNHCEKLGTPGVSSQSKTTIPSPYMDYTYLELANECGTCHENVHSFTYNEKYPLWIQNDSWIANNSISEISEVSSGSDTNKTVGVDSDDKSWESVSNVGKHDEYVNKNNFLNKETCQLQEGDILEFTKCCNSSHNDLNEKYCGVYEQIMEQRLEDLETLSFDFIESDQFSDSDTSGRFSDAASEDVLFRSKSS